VAKKKPSPRKGKKQRRYDWTEIRVAREVGGKSFKDLSDEFGPVPETISARSKREKWRDPVEVRAKASAKAADRKVSALVAQEASALFANRARHAEVSETLLKWVKSKVKAIADGTAKLPDHVSDVLEMRRLCMMLDTLEETDSRLAGLSKAAGDWRSDPGSLGADTVSSSDRILEALQGLEGGA
jgi:hypothetical protein